MVKNLMKVTSIKYIFILLLILLVAGCTPSQDIEPTVDIDAAVAGTVTAQLQALSMPTLQSPANGARFANPASVILAWDWVRDLGENEFYDLRVWRDGEPDYGITWTSDSEFSLAQWLSERDSGDYLWSVAVIEGDLETNTVLAEIGNAPEPRRFTVESNVLPTPTVEPTPAPFTVSTIVRSSVPDFTIDIVAHIPEAPTAITDIEFADDGSLFALAIDGRLYHLVDADADGIFEAYTQVLSPDISLEWAIGIAVYDDRIYISDQSRIGYIEDGDADGIFDTYTNLIDDLPGRVYPLHSNNGILIYDDLLYVAVGSTTDHGPIQDEYEAAILTMELDGSNLQIFARGFRNPYDLTMSPDGRLFTGDNSPDSVGAGLPFLPPEELNYVREGRHYGFPDVYGYGLELNDIDYETESAVTEFITSTATVGLAYYSGEQFPEAYRDGVFVGQFGGATPARNVLFVPLEATDDGNYRGEPQPFIQLIEGFEPVSIKVGADGALYITEWSHGYILRVSYTGSD